MVEKDMQGIFSKYTKSHLPKTAEVYELKICKGPSIPFNALQEHQEKALLDVEERGMFFKIPDQPVSWGANTKMRFSAKKPFDCMALVQIKAFVILWFYHARQPKVFIKIPIAKFIAARDNSSRKSLTEANAQEIGQLVYV